MAKEKKDKAPKADTKGKKDKAAKGESKEKASKEKAPEFKYGVSDLAEKLGTESASVRVKLRNAGVKKAGKSYGWNSKAELDEVAATLKSDEGKSKKAEKPAKGKEAKADKKGKKEKKSKD